ncbi:zinc-binding dehydrogenase [Rhodococcus sp. IEGM 1374]|uniref:zinc-binding dehydrogenase n=1 Tax=Rhodococcus sp. IEGM 1374 TaxID=3082221 RepID=UPI0029544310|nr:zinc-binding dehydrogenase [Rhodococcus sp. IEGM 1374]MDV7990456.1 zinc-binding dehydrogenase [Rhodococcus sp. IEGM 1374]
MQIHSISVNRGELSLMAARCHGWRPGQDVSGVVLDAAADGSGPPAGTAIVGMVDGAGWSELAAVRTDRMAVLPDTVGSDIAAGLPMAGLTALRTVRLGGDLLGRKILITGANGGVGRFQVQLSSAAGASVTAVTTAGENEANELIDLGAAEVTTTPSDASGPFDLIIESVGGAALETALSVLAPRGTLVMIGNSSGTKAELDVFSFMGHEGATITNYMSYAVEYPEREDLEVLVSLAADGRVDPTPGYFADLSELAHVIELMSRRKLPGGKAVLTISH